MLLFFSVPPQRPTIIDEKGKEVPSVAGPYEEGGDMKLTCIVSGGELLDQGIRIIGVTEG